METIKIVCDSPKNRRGKRTLSLAEREADGMWRLRNFRRGPRGRGFRIGRTDRASYVLVDGELASSTWDVEHLRNFRRRHPDSGKMPDIQRVFAFECTSCHERLRVLETTARPMLDSAVASGSKEISIQRLRSRIEAARHAATD